MRRGRQVVAGAIAAMCIASTASSQAPPAPVAGALARNALDGDSLAWFYNRPDAGVAEVESDLAFCVAFGAAKTGVENSAGIVADLTRGAMLAGSAHAYTDDCMIGLGYRRFNLSGEGQRAFVVRYTAMNEAQRGELVSTQVPPIGVLAREWGNSFWLPRDDDPLSPNARLRAVVANPPGERFVRTLRRLREEEIGDRAVIVGRLRISGPARAGFTLHSQNADTGLLEAAPISGGSSPIALDFDSARLIEVEDGPAGRVFQGVFVVPAGGYTLRLAGAGNDWVWFCLGAPSFRASPGSVIDIGEVTIDPGRSGAANGLSTPFRLRVDEPDLARTRAWLSWAPQWAGRLVAADFWNGLPSECPPALNTATLGPRMGIYRLEMPSAPPAE
jgi:hypothetical protein